MVQYSRLGVGGEVFLKTDNSYSAFLRDGLLYVRPALGIIRINEAGEVFVTAPVSRTPPIDPDSEARVG